MKIFKRIFAAIFIFVVIVFIGSVIFLKTFDANTYKPKIIQEIKKSIGRDAHVGDIALNFSFSQGVAVNLTDFRIADNPQFSNGDFLTVKHVTLGIDVLSFLTKQQVLISSVKITSPQMTLIRNAQGQFNVQTFNVGIAKQSLYAPNNPFNGLNVFSGIALAASDTVPVTNKNSPGSSLNLLVKSITLEDGVVRYKDTSFDPPMNFELSQIDARADNLSLEKPFNFSIELALLSQKKNVSIHGLGKIDIASANIRFDNVKVAFDLSDVSVSSLVYSLPMLTAAGIEEGIRGKMQATIEKMTVGPKGLSLLTLEGQLERGRVKLKQLPLALEGIDANFQATENKITLNGCTSGFGSGAVTATGTIDDYLKAQKFNFKTTVSRIDLSEVLPQDQPMQFKGKFFAEFNASGEGLSGNKAMLQSLAGDGTIEIKEGKLIGANILKIVLDKISMLPGLVDSVEANLPEKYKNILKEENTVFDNAKMKARISGGFLAIDETDVATDVFRLSGKGRIGFNQELDMQMAIAIPQDLSANMVSSVKGLEYLLDESGQIIIPLSINGKIPAVVFFPDLEYLGKKIIMNKGKEELEKVLGKVLGVENKDSGLPPQPSSSGDPQEKSPEKELIGNILDKIFR